MPSSALGIIVGVGIDEIIRIAAGTVTWSAKRGDFLSFRRYLRVVRDFREAARQINNLNLGVCFKEVNESADFELKHKENTGEWIGHLEQAFFPWSPPEDRIVYIFERAQVGRYGSPGAKIGICLHALCHILGLWHEFEEAEQEGCEELVLSGQILGYRNDASIMAYEDAKTKKFRDWTKARLDPQDERELRLLYRSEMTIWLISGDLYFVQDINLSDDGL